MAEGPPALRQLLPALLASAQGGSPVLLLGQPHVDKQALARALHDQGPRAAAPFVMLDCAQPSMTAEQYAEALAQAAGGTLYLAAVDALPLVLHAPLLDALQQRRSPPENSGPSLQARVVSSSALELPAVVERGDFRRDLFEYLSGVVISVPDELEADTSPKVPAEVEGWLAELPLSYRVARDAVTDTFERHYLKRVLTETEGNIREAARRGQINRSYLMELLKKHGFR